jgi:hypothetical protein
LAARVGSPAGPHCRPYGIVEIGQRTCARESRLQGKSQVRQEGTASRVVSRDHRGHRTVDLDGLLEIGHRRRPESAKPQCRG